MLGGVSSRSLGLLEVIDGVGNITVQADGNITFMPVLDWSGSFKLDYSICDDNGANTTNGAGDNSTATITVTPRGSARSVFAHVPSAPLAFEQ